MSVAALVLGSAGTWVTIGPVTQSGISHGHDGTLTLILAAIALLPFLLKRAVWIAVGCGVLALAVSVDNIVDVRAPDTTAVAAAPGWGVYVVAVAALSLCVWPCLARRDVTTLPEATEGV